MYIRVLVWVVGIALTCVVIVRVLVWVVGIALTCVVKSMEDGSVEAVAATALIVTRVKKTPFWRIIVTVLGPKTHVPDQHLHFGTINTVNIFLH